MVQLGDVFLKIGFVEKPPFMGGKVFAFESDQMKIEATLLHVSPSLNFGPGYAIHNTNKNGRIIQMEPNYVPATAESFEQGLAFIVYGVGLNEERSFGVVPEWYILGKKYKSFLPWEIEKERQLREYEMLPKVHLDINWMRLMAKMLKSWRDSTSKEDPISFHFDGAFLRFTCGKNQLPIPGVGKAWVERYSVKHSFLDKLPKRIHKHNVKFLIKGNQLNFANSLFDLIGKEPTGT